MLWSYAHLSPCLKQPQQTQQPQPPRPTHRLIQVCELWVFSLRCEQWQSSAGSPRELLGGEESGGCARCFGTSSRPSAWPWQLLSTTVLVRRRRWRCSRTAPHGDRRPPPGPGRRWCTTRTTPYGDRRHHLRGCGPAVSLTRGRRGATAPCGAPRGKLLSSLHRCWQTLRPRQWTPALSSTSSSQGAIEEARVALEPSRGSKRKRKKRRKRKLPKGGCRLFPPGCGRLCDLQQQVPAVQVVHVLEGAPASVHRQSGGYFCSACRDVYSQCELCRRLSSFYRCCSWTVPPPDIGGVGFGSSPNLDTKHTIYELCLPSERGCPDSAAPMCCGGVCVAMSCGGGGFPPDGAYDSACYSVRPMTGKYFINYFQYQEVVGCVCMLNGWFSNNDDICADNYIFSRFKLKDICRSEKWELYLYGDKIIKVDRDRVEVLPRVCLRLGSSPNLATGHTPSLSCAAF